MAVNGEPVYGKSLAEVPPPPPNTHTPKRAERLRHEPRRGACAGPPRAGAAAGSDRRGALPESRRGGRDGRRGRPLDPVTAQRARRRSPPPFTHTHTQARLLTWDSDGLAQRLSAKDSDVSPKTQMCQRLGRVVCGLRGRKGRSEPRAGGLGRAEGRASLVTRAHASRGGEGGKPQDAGGSRRRRGLELTFSTELKADKSRRRRGARAGRSARRLGRAARLGKSAPAVDQRCTIYWLQLSHRPYLLPPLTHETLAEKLLCSWGSSSFEFKLSQLIICYIYIYIYNYIY